MRGERELRLRPCSAGLPQFQGETRIQMQTLTSVNRRERMREEAAPMPPGYHSSSRRHPEERSSGNPASRLQRQTEEPSAIGLALRRLNDRTATIAAATRLKNRRWVVSIIRTLPLNESALRKVNSDFFLAAQHSAETWGACKTLAATPQWRIPGLLSSFASMYVYLFPFVHASM